MEITISWFNFLPELLSYKASLLILVFFTVIGFLVAEENIKNSGVYYIIDFLDNITRKNAILGYLLFGIFGSLMLIIGISICAIFSDILVLLYGWFQSNNGKW